MKRFVKNGSRYDYYIDGRKELTGSPGSIDGRFSLDTAVYLYLQSPAPTSIYVCWYASIGSESVQSNYDHRI